MLIVQNAATPANIRNAVVDMIAAGATDVRVAAAYVTRGGASILLNALSNSVTPAAFAAMPKTLITSFDFGLTEPQALRRWLEAGNATVRVSGAQRLAQGSLMPLRAFHPKLYTFGRNAQTCSALIGSANLTSRGLPVRLPQNVAERAILGKDRRAVRERRDLSPRHRPRPIHCSDDHGADRRPPSAQLPSSRA